jgi:hypothetical protein
MAAVLNRRTPMQSIGYGEGRIREFDRREYVETPLHTKFKLRLNFNLAQQGARVTSRPTS